MPPQRGRKGKTGVKIIVGVSILLVVLLVGLGGFVALRSRIAPSSKTNTSPSQPAAQVSPTATTSLAPTATPTQQATPTPTPKPTPKATPTPTPKPVTKYVTIEDTPNGSYNFAFSPATVTIPVGGIVTWTNKSQTPHNVTSTNGNTLNSGLMNTGKTFSFKFTKSGTYHYDCSIHPYMMGTVIVT
jgi:plastocyanin